MNELITYLNEFLIMSQEENKLLDRTNRQKVVEVEKLVQTVHELEESLLSNGETNNALLEYQRKISELNVRLFI